MVKKNPKNKRASSAVDDDDGRGEHLDDWVAQLARRASSSGGDGSTTTKDERIQKRQAKKQRREVRKQDSTINNKNKKRDDDGVVFVQHQPEPASSNRRTADEIMMSKRSCAPQQHRAPHEEETELLLHVLSKRVQECVESKTAAEGGVDKKSKKWCQPYTPPGGPISGKKKKRQHLADVLQPRRSDYGGIGLARKSLYIDLQDPSCTPQLEQEFTEHIPGFFGKQRTKAMKKQLEGNMLWRQLLKQKEEQESSSSTNNSKKKKKKLKGLSPDERVEAMLKSGAI